MKARGFEIVRRMQKYGAVDSPEFKGITAFCMQAIQDMHGIGEGKQSKDIIQGGKHNADKHFEELWCNYL